MRKLDFLDPFIIQSGFDEINYLQSAGIIFASKRRKEIAPINQARVSLEDPLRLYAPLSVRLTLE